MTSSETLIIKYFAIYNETPLVAKAITIKNGITNIKVWSLLINNFSIAGSKSHAVAEVLPATIRDKKREMERGTINRAEHEINPGQPTRFNRGPLYFLRERRTMVKELRALETNKWIRPQSK